MRKNYLLIFLVLLLYNSCRKDGSSSIAENTEFTVAEAKVYLKSQKINSSNIVLNAPKSLLSLSQAGKSNAKIEQEVGYTYWEKANSFKLDARDVVEVPFISNNKSVNIYNFLSTYTEDQENLEKVAKSSFTNLLVYKNPDGTVEKAFVTYIPDWQYVDSVPFDMGKNSLAAMNKEFRGYIEYKNWDQEVTLLLRIIEGKVVSRFRMNADKLVGHSVSRASVQSSCRTVCIPVYQVVCGGPFERPGSGSEECAYTQVGQNCVTVCDQGGTDPSDPPTPPGGSQEGNDNPDVTGTIQAIFDLQSICPEMQSYMDRFTQEISDLTSHTMTPNPKVRCVNLQLLNLLRKNSTSEKIKLCLTVNTTAYGAKYQSGTKTLNFSQSSSIRSDFIFHELFHALQDKTYAGGISQYGEFTGFSDIEWEVHFFVDLLNRMNAEIGNLYYGSNSEAYKTWISGLTDNGTRLGNVPDRLLGGGGMASYNKYREEFKTAPNRDLYNRPSIGLSPMLIKSLIESLSSECKN